jgi:hypothetical protein
MQAQTSRPTVVTVLGWLFIVYGVLAILGALVAVGMLLLAKVAGSAAFPGGMHGQASPFTAMAGSPGAVALGVMLRLAVGAFVIAAAVSFLRLQSWSRVALRVFCWVAIAYTVISGFLGLRALPRMMAAMPQGQQVPPGFERGIAAFAAITTVAVIVVMVVIYALAIWALGLPAVRQAMARSQPVAPASPGATT